MTIYDDFSVTVGGDIRHDSGTATYTVLELPKFIFSSVIFFGGFLLVIQFIRRIHGCLQNLREPQDRESRPKHEPGF